MAKISASPNTGVKQDNQTPGGGDPERDGSFLSRAEGEKNDISFALNYPVVLLMLFDGFSIPNHDHIP